MRVILYTDGSAMSGSKKGGWGALVYIPEFSIFHELWGCCTNVTSMQAEIYAILNALYHLPIIIEQPLSELQIEIYSDAKVLSLHFAGTHCIKKDSRLIKELEKTSQKYSSFKVKYVRGAKDKNINVFNKKAHDLSRNYMSVVV